MEKIDAIVLGTSPYAEATLLLRLLTREHGVVRALAKGARRGARQTQAAWEPLARIHAALWLKTADALGTLGEARLIDGWDYLRADMTRLAYASLGVELLGAVAGEAPPEPFYFNEACAFLELLREARGPGSVTILLMLRLLAHAGFPPQMAQPWTAETLPPMLVYDFAAGMLDIPQAGDGPHTQRLAGRALAPLLPLFDEIPPLEAGLSLPAPAGPPLLRWLVRVWEDHLHRRLKAARFLEEMILHDPEG